MNHLYSISEAAAFGSVTTPMIDHHRRSGWIPNPSHLMSPRGTRFYYTEKEVVAIRYHFSKSIQEIRRERGYFDQQDCAQQLGITALSFCHKVSEGILPRPTLTLKGYRTKFYSA